MIDSEDLSIIVNCISVFTPIVLLSWFIVSTKRTLSAQYYSEIVGDYGGFTAPIDNSLGVQNGGVLLRILNIDGNGYFQGEFDFGENKTTITPDNQLQFQQMRDGIFSCYGKIDHKVYRSKDRDIMDSKDNRTYSGKFYVVDRLDIDFRTTNITNYIQLEYDIVHFREMKTIEFKLNKVHREVNKLPLEITVYKKIGLLFDVYTSVKQSSFRDFHSRYYGD